MTVSAKVLGLDSLRDKMLRLAGPEGKAQLKAANEKSAKEFMNLVRIACPRDDDAGGHLIDTLTQEERGEVGVTVSIGREGGEFGYPLHLEAGHKAKNGKHVPPKPFWFPSLRVLRRRSAGRGQRAIRVVVKAIAGTSTTMPA
jgi:hypothetical protein